MNGQYIDSKGLSIVSARQDVTLDFPNSEFRKMTAIIIQWIE